jgi:hypothetical protein
LGNFLIVLPAQNGPDDADMIFSHGVELAHSLLSVRPSAQLHADWFHAASFPRQNGSGSAIACHEPTGSWIVAAGTWFHADGLSSGDETELLDRYLKGNTLQLGLEMEGSFAIVIGDGRSREVVVITDICGNLHCFVRKSSRAIAISGSSLLLAALETFRLDDVALQEFIAAGVIYEDRSIFQEVRKFGPATVERIKPGANASVTKRYWSPASVPPESVGGDEAVRALWSGLCSAAQKIGKAFPHPLCDLTGGYDSRAEVAAFVESGIPIAVTVSGPRHSADVAVSQGLAGLAGIPHIYFDPPPEISLTEARKALTLTDGEYDLVLYSRVQRIHESSIGKYDISVNGSFGEVARGYWWELLFPHVGEHRPLDTKMIAARRFAAGAFDPSVFRSNPPLAEHLAGAIDRVNLGMDKLPNTLQMDSAYILIRMQRWHGRIMSSTNRLWPCVSPFMFRSVLDVMLAARARDRQRSFLIRRMLKKFQPKWADYPLEHGYPAAPATWKNFHRFAPLARYYAGRALSKIKSRIGWRNIAAALPELSLQRLHLWSQEDVRELLNPEKMRLASILDPVGLKSFLHHSRQSHFPYDEQFTRILTLETALKVLGSARSE